MRRLLFAWDDLKWSPLAYGLRHPASASCLGRHARLAGRCPNNSSLFPPLAAVVVVAGHIQRKDYFKFRNTGASADAPVFHFHRWGRNEKWQLQRRFLRKRGAAEKFPADLQRTEPSQALPRQLSQGESQAVKFITKVLGIMKKLPAVLLALPLRKDFPRSGGRCRAATKGGIWQSRGL